MLSANLVGVYKWVQQSAYSQNVFVGMKIIVTEMLDYLHTGEKAHVSFANASALNVYAERID
jgi:hypothetical protein